MGYLLYIYNGLSSLTTNDFFIFTCLLPLICAEMYRHYWYLEYVISL